MSDAGAVGEAEGRDELKGRTSVSIVSRNDGVFPSWDSPRNRERDVDLPGEAGERLRGTGHHHTFRKTLAMDRSFIMQEMCIGDQLWKDEVVARERGCELTALGILRVWEGTLNNKNGNQLFIC